MITYADDGDVLDVVVVGRHVVGWFWLICFADLS
jgi:hypothetical protein